MATLQDDKQVSPYLAAPQLIHSTSKSDGVCGIASLGDEVFFALHWKPDLQVIDINTFAVLRKLPVAGLVSPWDLVSTQHNNTIYVAEWQGCCVLRIELPGTVTRWPLDDQPESLYVTPRSTIIVSFYRGSPKELTSDGQLVRAISLPETITSILHTVTLPSGQFVVSDGGPAACIANMFARLCIVDMSGQIQKSYGEHGSTGEPLNRPHYIAVDTQGYIIVAETGKNRVLLFSPSLACIGELISTEQGLAGPYRMLLDEARGLLFIGESSAGRLLIYRIKQNIN